MKLSALAAIVCVFPFLLGTNAQGHGAHDELVSECLEMLEKTPDDPAMRHRLAMAYVHHGDWELALIELDKLDGSLTDSRLTRARALMLGSRHEQARVLLDAILEKSSEDSQALLERARVFAALKKPTESLADYRNALNLTTIPNPEFCLEMAEILTAQNQTDEALVVIQKGLTTNGDVPTLLLRSLELETATGKYDAALSRLAVLEKQAPRPEPWMARRAELLAQAGRAEEARAAWIALKQHISELPNLQRGTPDFLALSAKADAALASH
ncbi:MAG: tetratricopeptide repeat protein [Gloeobacteraceae cyanobacterium ES-bin-144]|nr:tetratricopeptide repeat protein [Verrucomicrobiales bacterium]